MDERKDKVVNEENFETDVNKNKHDNVYGEEDRIEENLNTTVNTDFDSDDSIKDKNYCPSDTLSESDEESILGEVNHEDMNMENAIVESEVEMIDPADNNTNDKPKKKLTRKRTRNPESWGKNTRKKRRNTGQEYVSTKGKNVAAKKMKDSCSEKCRLKCRSKITEEERKNIFDYYWRLGDIEQQRSFLNKCMSDYINPEYRASKPGNNRSKNVRYTFSIDERHIQVCKTFFKNTLAINNRIIFTTIKKRNVQGGINKDQRGKRKSDKAIREDIKDDIRTHINSFPRVSSHYCRARTNKEYLDGSLNISIMYRLYVQDCVKKQKQYAKHWVYAQVLNNETNIGFHIPKKDQCSLCENYKNGSEESKKLIRQKFEDHLREKELSRQEKATDIENKNLQVYCYDLQAVLSTPCGDVNSFYYKRKLATYNFTLFDVKKKKGYCYLWHEGVARRGANEIASCVYKFISLSSNENLVFYSDNCTGQNKNKFIIGMYLYCIQSIEKIKSISHKFLIVGHTQNEGDSMHAAIEKEKKRVLRSGPIYVPSQWSIVVASAKKQGTPYAVDEISTKDIIDFKTLSKKIGNNYNINTDKEKVNWKDIKIFRVEKEEPFTIQYKTSYGQESFKKIQVRKRRMRLQNSSNVLELTPAYRNPPTISLEKKKEFNGIVRRKYYQTCTLALL